MTVRAENAKWAVLCAAETHAGLRAVCGKGQHTPSLPLVFFCSQQVCSGALSLSLQSAANMSSPWACPAPLGKSHLGIGCGREPWRCVQSFLYFFPQLKSWQGNMLNMPFACISSRFPVRALIHHPGVITLQPCLLQTVVHLWLRGP